MKICSRCIYDDRTPAIEYNNDGVCNYCLQIDNLISVYGTGNNKGLLLINKIIADIRRKGKGKKYDCVIGVSGGTDSSYLLYLAKKKWNLRPLAVHYDNTWNSAIATTNIQKVLAALDIDLYTHVVDNKESDDIFKSMFLASVPELEAPTDLGYAYTLRIAAKKYNIKYIFEGHSFTEEGITPLGKNYFDGKYIDSIHKQYGSMKIKTYPLMTLTRFLKSIIINRVHFIRPLWYIEYSKKNAQNFLKSEYKWEYYGGHHLENRMSTFYHSVYSPEKFNIDYRNNSLSAQVRSNQLTRKEALKIYATDPVYEDGLIEYFQKRLNLTNNMYVSIMESKPKYWQEYPNYKKTFERLRFLFYLFAKLNLIPFSFYFKYCLKGKD